jgi:N6-adenosine-specific RNA methylase IME4
LFGARGKPKQRAHAVRNLVIAKVREHLRKPDEIYEMLEAMFLDANKLDIFGRASRSGWTIVGDQPTMVDRVMKEKA